MKEKWFAENGYTILKSKLAFGDYAFPNDMSIVVDTKQDCRELYTDLIQDHERFRKECKMSQKCGIRLYILVENKYGFTKPDDIINWKNPLFFKYWKDKKNGSSRKPPVENKTLLQIMHSMTRDYGVQFLFCSTEDAAKTIIDILTRKDGDPGGFTENQE